jgi:hypothetical protein
MATIIVILKRPDELTGNGKQGLIPYLEQTVKPHVFLLSKKPPILNQLSLSLVSNYGLWCGSFYFSVRVKLRRK